jgi:NitT/TauT family transport system ATP-binding protein
MGTLLDIKNLSKTYANGTLALQDVNVSLNKGEFFALLGPSGCGKTTLLRLIAGLDRPTAGKITWADKASQHETGFVFQEATLLPWATVYENVYLPFRLRHIPRNMVKSRIEAMLERLGLLEFSDAVPRELSGGMKMRVSIARALVTGAQLLLMDEPFAALDEITRFKLNDELLELWHATGTTIVFVTHSVFESVYLSQRIGVMTQRPGRIAEIIDVPEFKSSGQTLRTCVEYNAVCAQVSYIAETANAQSEAA